MAITRPTFKTWALLLVATAVLIYWAIDISDGSFTRRNHEYHYPGLWFWLNVVALTGWSLLVTGAWIGALRRMFASPPPPSLELPRDHRSPRSRR